MLQVATLSPGTQHVTLGGAVAADVHGKNHHVHGCIGDHLRCLKMRLADGRIVTAEPDGENADLFWATVGGMGLTGHILVKTGMTAGLDPPLFAGTPHRVAERVLRAIDRGRPVVYAPAPWRLVMATIRLLPRAVMRRVAF